MLLKICYMTVLFLVIIHFENVSFASQQQFHTIYDERHSKKTLHASDSEVAFLKRVVASKAAMYWKQKAKDCDPEFEVIDIARGSFTSPTVNQKAVLYRYCITGHNFALNGIAILEKDSVVTHVVYEGAWDLGIDALQDLNKDGLSEILISSGGTNMGETWEVINLLQLRNGKVISVGQTETYLDTCDSESVKKSCTAYKISALSAPTPTFKRERYEKSCQDNKWKHVSTEPFTLEKDRIRYEVLK